MAKHIALDKPVAVKILPPSLGGGERVERFLKEARTCSRIEHPNVVIIHDVGEDGGLHYIVMQYVHGRNLKELVSAQRGPLPWRSALRMTELSARGLHAVHEHGLVHRDVKPSNIMFAADGRIILMDFGLVREEADAGLTHSGQVVGTPAYMSPEQCRGEPLDRRSDIFSLGSTLYYLLSGREPFEGTLQELLSKIAAGARPRPIRLANQEVPEEVERLLERAMAQDCRNRFASASVMAQELKRIIRASQVKSTSAWRTVEISAASVDTQQVGELEPVELLPLGSRWDPVRDRLPWITAAAGGIVCLAMLALGLNHLFNPPSEPDVPKPMAAVATPVTEQEPRRPDTAGMVLIDAGYARLGNRLESLRAHFATIPELVENEALMESALEAARRETVQRVWVDAFWIGRYEVTNAQYAEFVEATGHEPPEGWDGAKPPVGTEDCPVDNVRHQDAEAYARWAGKQLPTRAQWMRAYRGDSESLFPWGDRFDADRANVAENREFPSIAPVATMPRDRSPFGVYNLVGNASEYLRERMSYQGRDAVVIKGAHYNARGSIYGLGCMQVILQRDLTSPGFGFRCVAELPVGEASPPPLAQ